MPLVRESQEVREGRDGWRRPHPEQPLGGTDGCRTRQHGGSGLKSTTGAGQGGSLAWVAQGGCYIKNQVSDPISSACGGSAEHGHRDEDTVQSVPTRRGAFAGWDAQGGELP